MHLNTVQKERYFSRCWLDNYPRLHLSELRSVLNLLCKVGGRPRRWLSPVFHLWPQTTLGSPGPSGTTQFNTSRHSPQKPLCAYAPSFFLYFFPLFFFLLTTIRCCLCLSLYLSLDGACHLIRDKKRPFFLIGPWERIQCWKLSTSIWFNLWNPKAQRGHTFWVTPSGCWYDV